MKFKIDDSPAAGKSELVDRCIKALDVLSDGELLTSRGLAQKLGLVATYVGCHTGLIPAEFSAKDGKRKLYGNKKTIAEWKKSRIQN